MHTGTGKGSARSRAGAILMAVLGSIPLTAVQAAAPIVDASQMVRAEGPRWVTREGKPIVLKFPREKLADDLHAIARLVTEPDPSSQPAPQRPARRWWSRLGARASEA